MRVPYFRKLLYSNASTGCCKGMVDSDYSFEGSGAGGLRVI